MAEQRIVLLSRGVDEADDVLGLFSAGMMTETRALSVTTLPPDDAAYRPADDPKVEHQARRRR